MEISNNLSFKKFLWELVNNYDGIDIFSDENKSRLNKALCNISKWERKEKRFFKERDVLLTVTRCNVVQSLYAVRDNPQNDKLDALKNAKNELIANYVEERVCNDFLSNISLILYKIDLIAWEEKKKENDNYDRQALLEKTKNYKAYIAKIDGIESIPNEDSVELADVSGVNVVVEKNRYSIGDFVVYIKPEVRVRSTYSCFEILKDSDFVVEKKQIGGVWSDGIIVKPSDISIFKCSLGQNVSKYVLEPTHNQEKKPPKEEFIDDQDIRHWSEKKFYKNVYSSKQFREADLEAKKEMRRASKEEAKMIKALRRDAGLGGGCYITTAICEASGKADDCHELTMMRKFRDEWLAKQPDGMYIINDYYETAPKIVTKINSLKNKERIYDFLGKNFLSKCIRYVEDNQMNDCKKCYMDMVLYCGKFLVDKT